ncbi:hypothetical protein EYF80_033580 [Liparis tanakae]|uniref:Uncharacterized protein n=1 Tax=Liparis tanakae TaxID=230148 RepID=A0A4Z2GUC6_9TELE|nr:hypothetical protein EYF80_033580 [Liparis tanakae]
MRCSEVVVASCVIPLLKGEFTQITKILKTGKGNRDVKSSSGTMRLVRSSELWETEADKEMV